MKKNKKSTTKEQSNKNHDCDKCKEFKECVCPNIDIFFRDMLKIKGLLDE